jgi:hypothetical protein
MGRTTCLTPYQMFRLDLACQPIVEAYGQHVYLVGSAYRPTQLTMVRDIDVRLILSDKKYDRMIPTSEVRTMLSMAFTAYLSEATDLPIDFGVQRRTEANEQHSGPRNPLGIRCLGNWTGDAPKEGA